jgi:hypothetical protein
VERSARGRTTTPEQGKGKRAPRDRGAPRGRAHSALVVAFRWLAGLPARGGGDNMNISGKGGWRIR